MKALSYLFLILLLSGCSKKTPVEFVEDTQVLFPLASGNVWSYTFQTLKVNGILDTIIDTSVFLVEGEAFGTYYSVQYTTTFQSVAINYYYKNSDEGLWVYNTTSGTEEFFLKYPSDSGDTHNWRHFSVETISKDTLIATDTGLFSCYHYHLSTGDSSLVQSTQHIDYFFAPNFGLILQLNRTFAHNVVQSGSIQTLIDYNLVK